MKLNRQACCFCCCCFNVTHGNLKSCVPIAVNDRERKTEKVLTALFDAINIKYKWHILVTFSQVFIAYFALIGVRHLSVFTV